MKARKLLTVRENTKPDCNPGALKRPVVAVGRRNGENTPPPSLLQFSSGWCFGEGHVAGKSLEQAEKDVDDGDDEPRPRPSTVRQRGVLNANQEEREGADARSVTSEK